MHFVFAVDCPGETSRKHINAAFIQYYVLPFFFVFVLLKFLTFSSLEEHK